MPLTEAQLRSKREEFWDTAPAFEGKTEIWAALKAAVEAATREDQVLRLFVCDQTNATPVFQGHTSLNKKQHK